jgi:hypothetical protein
LTQIPKKLMNKIYNEKEYKILIQIKIKIHNCKLMNLKYKLKDTHLVVSDRDELL